MMENIAEGSVVEGIVKNITDYGAFIDLGGVDGLLHVTDISWKRVNHPSELLQVGQTVNVQIIRFNQETGRISLGMKQLETDPWEGVSAKYPIKGVFKGRVTNITDYGAFVELEDGIEGLVHVSEMSWTKKNVHPGKINVKKTHGLAFQINVKLVMKSKVKSITLQSSAYLLPLMLILMVWFISLTFHGKIKLSRL